MSEAVIAQIRQRLEQALAPTMLDIIDEGHQHVGHASEGQGHYRVRIASAAFAGKPPLARHRLVYAAVDDLMGQGIHALAIEAGVPK
ncbi:MAG TPA: BolA family protein [Rhodanobacteraceae bacterium]